MNLENLEKIARWLEAGAPHVIFDMEHSVTHPADVASDLELSEAEYLAQQNESSRCGTVCCIAGAVYLMKRAPEGQLFPSPEMQFAIEETVKYWPGVYQEALGYLGLEFSNVEMGHDLFDPDLAPKNCTPAQAAEAVRRVMKGEAPW